VLFRSLAAADWRALVPRSPLAGNSTNEFVVHDWQRVSHVRLNIFPDGGVARLRVHGEVAPDWPRLLALGGPVDLAAVEHGGHVVAASDMFFGNRANLIKPGAPKNMSDGWETKRRRGPGHDWAIVRLGARGTVERVVIDTTHFKGNAPGRATLEGSADGESWRPLLDSRVQPHTRHVFDAELRRVGLVRHVRLSVFPDGGVARLRVFGWPEVDEPGTSRLDALPRDKALEALRACCGSTRWMEAMEARRPFGSLPPLLRIAEQTWWALGEADWLEAFAAHPQIGERSASKWSEGEQAGARAAGAGVQAELADVNRAYRDRHGFIYIVCASGRSAEAMLADARARLERPRDEELRTAAEEQAKILRLRLQKWVAGT